PAVRASGEEWRDATDSARLPSARFLLRAIFPVMRAQLTRFALLASLAVAACEDGPTQTYAPGPASNGANGSYVAPPGFNGYFTGFGKPYGGGCGGGRSCICTPDETASRWAWMVKQPIVPPNGA